MNEQYEMSAEDAAVRRYFEVVRGMHPGWSAAADTLDELFNLIDEAELFLDEAELPL